MSREWADTDDDINLAWGPPPTQQVKTAVRVPRLQLDVCSSGAHKSNTFTAGLQKMRNKIPPPPGRALPSPKLCGRFPGRATAQASHSGANIRSKSSESTPDTASFKLVSSEEKVPRRALGDVDIDNAQRTEHRPFKLESCEEKVPRAGGDRDSSPDAVEEALSMAVVKRLLGQEMRLIVRSELQAILPSLSAGARSPVGARSPAITPTELRSDADDEVDVSSKFVHSAIRHLTTEDWRAENIDVPLGVLPWRLRALLDKASERLMALGTLEAPSQPKYLKSFVEGSAWSTLINLTILLNCAYMIYSVNYQVENYLEEESTNTPVFWCDVLFTLFYLTEFALKLAVYRAYYFYGVNYKANIFDALLLLASIWSVAFTLIVSSSQAMQNFTWLRVLRLLRMVKVLRVIRLASYFHTLRAMLTSLLDSFWMFAWSLAMLSIVYFTFSLVFVSRLGAHFSAEGPDLDLQEVDPLVRSYGSVERSMGSLLLVSTGGRDWGDDLELVGKVDQLSQVVLVVFILFSHIALMNIILGVFVEDAMKNLQPDDFQKARHLVEQEELFSRELLTLCEDMDGRSGRLSLHEWNQGLKSGRIRELLRLFGLHTHHVEKFFFMLCEQNKANGGDDSVDTAEFVRGCMRLRGTASMFDMHGLQFEVLALKELMLKELRMLRNMRSHRPSKGSSAA